MGLGPGDHLAVQPGSAGHIRAISAVSKREPRHVFRDGPYPRRFISSAQAAAMRSTPPASPRFGRTRNQAERDTQCGTRRQRRRRARRGW
jgi:hypothetical protein